jgi:hypothetical protein
MKVPNGWGVIRYMPIGGGSPEEDPCAFDGWHSIKAAAEAVYKDWLRRYPDWVVALVEAERVRFTNKMGTLPLEIRAQLRTLHGLAS